MIRLIIKAYILLIIVDTIFRFFPQLQSKQWVKVMRQWSNYGLDPIRKYMPGDLPFDFSPLVVIALLNLIMILW